MTAKRYTSGLIRVVGLSAIALALALHFSAGSAEAQSTKKRAAFTVPAKAARADGTRQIVVEETSTKFKIAAPKSPRVDSPAAGNGGGKLHIEVPKVERPKANKPEVQRPKVAVAHVPVEPKVEKVAAPKVEEKVEEKVEKETKTKKKVEKKSHKKYYRHGDGYGRYYDGPPPRYSGRYGGYYEDGPRHYGRSYSGYSGRSYGGYSGCN